MHYQNLYLSELEDFLESHPSALLLDVRQPYEFAEFALPDAKLIPLNVLASQIDEIETHRNTSVVVYCKAGVRSVYACNILHEFGFTDLYNIADGVISLLPRNY
jgi:rhodanese-related sulfurtransferase